MTAVPVREGQHVTDYEPFVGHGGRTIDVPDLQHLADSAYRVNLASGHRDAFTDTVKP